MLSEARARLANTKGKKAKRKAREKQLEEARRLAVLQKNREMQAAGLEVKGARLKSGAIDYNTEIPFERRPPPGFFNTRDEDQKAREQKEAEGFQPISLAELKGKSREQVEEEERKRDAKRIRLMRESDLPAVFEQVNRMNDVDMVAKRMSLHLPAPVLQEDELEAIAKLSDLQREEERKQAIESASSHSATRALLTPSFATPLLPSHSARATPLLASQRTPLAVDNVGKEADNLLRLMNARTPLLGGENKELHPSDFSRATPIHQPVQTPKPMTPLMSGDANRTPASLHENQQPPSTPLRDGTPSAAFPSSSAAPSTSMSASEAISAQSQRSAQREEKARKSHLKQLLSMLPAPRNEYALSGQQLSGLQDEEKKEQTVEDREETDRRERAAEEARRQSEWEKETQAIQRHLPRPSTMSPRYVPQQQRAEALSAVELQVLQEARALIEWDTRRWPVGAKQPSTQPRDSAMEAVDQTRIQHAQQLVAEQLVQQPSNSDHIAAFAASLSTSPEPLSTSQLRSVHDSLAAAVKKAGSKCAVQLGGYHALHSKLRQDIAELETQLADARREHSCYTVLQAREETAVERRMKDDMAALSAMKQEEGMLQEQYGEWMTRHQSQPSVLRSSVPVHVKG